MSYVMFKDAGLTRAIFGERVMFIKGETPPGLDILQPTEASRGRACRQPVGGVRNLLQYTEEIDNPIWAEQETIVIPNAALAPNNVMAADKIVEAASGGVHQVFQIHNFLPNTDYVYSQVLEAAGRDEVRLGIGSGAFGGVEPSTIFNLTTGQKVAGSGGILPLGNGRFRCWVTATSDADGGVVGVTTRLLNNGTAVYSGDGSSGVYVWGSQLEKGTEPSEYQRVRSEFDAFEEGARHVSGVAVNGATEHYPIGPFASGFSGEMALFTPQGVWIEQTVTAPAGGSVMLGPVNGPGGTPNLLVTYPRIFRWELRDQPFDAGDRDRLRRYSEFLGLPGHILS